MIPTDMDSQAWTRENLAWAAGFYEGEGCRSIKHVGSGYYYAQITINTTDEDIIRRWALVFRVENQVRGPYLNGSRIGKKPYWNLNVNGYARPLAIISALWPWLGTRRRAQAHSTLIFARDNWLEHRAMRP